jgi:hypothetical protein
MRPFDVFLSLMKFWFVLAAIALALPAALFFIASKRRLARTLSRLIVAVFGALALLDFLDIDSCLAAGGIWNYATRTCQLSR